jgi:hypothetical protein
VPTTLLLPQIVDAVGIPVVAAGGFFDGRGLVAALAYGAAGIAMGTRFLLTKESTVSDAVKQEYLARSVTDTVVTTPRRRRAAPRPQNVLCGQTRASGLGHGAAQRAQFRGCPGCRCGRWLRDWRALQHGRN